MAVLALLATVSGTATVYAMGGAARPIEAGLMGYNAALVGCAFHVFLPGLSPLLRALASAAGGVAASVVAAALQGGKTPQWTLAFNFVALSVLVHVGPLAGADVAEPPAPDSLLDAHWSEVALAPLVGVAQIFVVLGRRRLRRVPRREAQRAPRQAARPRERRPRSLPRPRKRLRHRPPPPIAAPRQL